MSYCQDSQNDVGWLVSIKIGPWTLVALIFLFSSLFGEMIQFDLRAYFSEWVGGFNHQQSHVFLREPQHTPGAYPRHPQTPKWKEFLHKLLVGGLGYAPGVCWKVHRVFECQDQFMWASIRYLPTVPSRSILYLGRPWSSRIFFLKKSLFQLRLQMENHPLGGGFKHFLFSLLFGEDSHFD